MGDPGTPADAKPRPRLLTEVAWALGAGLLSLLAAAVKVDWLTTARNLWDRGDLTGIYAMARALLTHPWITPNPDLAYPFVQDLGPSPTPDVIHVASLKLLVGLTQDPVLAVNAFIMVGFATAAIAMYVLARLVRITPFLAFALSVAFALVPWHFVRFTHPFLSHYAVVPLALLLVLAVSTWPMALSGAGRIRGRTLVLLLLLCAWIGLSGVYYAVFGTILALATLLVQVLTGRRDRGLLLATWLALLPALLSLATATVLRMLAIHPAPAIDPIARAPEESQLFGGAVFTLFRTQDMWSQYLPVRGLHGVEVLGNALEPDARNSTIGVIAVIISALAVAAILLRNGRDTRSPLLESLGPWPWLFALSTAFFAMGALGQVFSVVFLHQIRSWGRFSIVVICIALLILGLLIQHLSSRWRWLAAGAATLVLLSTALDLATWSPRPHERVGPASTTELRSYGAALDTTLDDGCGVFQLPAQGYPESRAPEGTYDYDPLLPYLYSFHPRWSYGGIKGTEAGDWQRRVGMRPVFTIVPQLQEAGFCAVQVDMDAYGRGASPTTELDRLLGPPAVVSDSGRWQLYLLS